MHPFHRFVSLVFIFEKMKEEHKKKLFENLVAKFKLISNYIPLGEIKMYIIILIKHYIYMGLQINENQQQNLFVNYTEKRPLSSV